MGAQAGAKYDGTTHHASGADELAVQVTSRPVTPYRLRPFGCHTVVLSRKIAPPHSVETSALRAVSLTTIRWAYEFVSPQELVSRPIGGRG